MMVKKAVCIGLWCLLLSPGLIAQLNLPVGGARSFAMGGAGLTFTDIHAAWTNPAGLAELRGPSGAAYVEQRFGLEELRGASLVAGVEVPNGGVGILVHTFGYATYREQQVGVAYGIALSDVLRIGVQLSGFNWSIEGYGNRWLIGGSVGVQTAVADNFDVALRVSNPVRQDIVEGTELPSLLAIGLNYRPNPAIQLLAEVEKDIDFPARVRMGLDYKVLEEIQLRIGLATDPALISLGLSYRVLPALQLDAGFQYNSILGVSPAFGLVYQPPR